MSITLGKNIPSLIAQRKLAEGSHALSKVYERLSTSLRINTAKDDAAGLSIASKLNADARVYSQGIRNLSDGSSMLAIAEGALQSLGSITTRISELAEQAANGTYSTRQRTALNTEGEKLIDEYNRIIQSTSFNGVAMFASAPTTVTLQDGYGTQGSLTISIGSQLAATVGEDGAQVGDATFKSAYSGVPSGASQTEVYLIDVNNDGKLDYLNVVAEGGSGTLLGNGDGTFGQLAYVAPNGNPSFKPIIGNFLGSSSVDLAFFDSFGNLYVSQGDNGTSWAAASSSTPAPFGAVRSAYAGDFNGDGWADIAVNGTGGTYVLHNNGTGGFSNAQTISAVDGSAVYGDFNEDGRVDIALGSSIYTGQATGLFSAGATIASVFGGVTGDFNNDGNLDILSSQLSYGNGDGTFKAGVNVTLTPLGVGASFSGDMLSGDFNGDGYTDLAVAYSSTSPGEHIQVYTNNKSGGFTAGQMALITLIDGIATGDVNGDGILDFASSRNGEILLGNGNTSIINVPTNNLSYVDLTSQSSARTALTTMQAVQTRISNELGSIGGFQSRITAAAAALSAKRDESVQAASRIVSADIAEEAANALRLRIQQNVTQAVLSQANKNPEFILKLLLG
jgi:flagellin